MPLDIISGRLIDHYSYPHTYYVITVVKIKLSIYNIISMNRLITPGLPNNVTCTNVTLYFPLVILSEMVTKGILPPGLSVNAPICAWELNTAMVSNLI